MSLTLTGALANAKNRADFGLLQAAAADDLDLGGRVSRLLAYTGFLHPEPYGLLVQRVTRDAVAAGLVPGPAEVFSAPGRVSDAVLRAVGERRFSYLPVATPLDLQERILGEEVPNAHRSDVLPPRVSRRLHQLTCPAIKCHSRSDLDLFIGPCAFQVIDRRNAGYLQFAASRPMSSAIFDVPQVTIGRPVVLVQDTFNGYNFAHFLFDWIVRVGLLIDAGVEGAQDALFAFGGLPNVFHQIVVDALMRAYGLSSENIFFPAADVLIRPPRLIFFSDQVGPIGHPAQMFRHEAVRVLRSVIRCAAIDRQAPRRRLYVSRGDVGRRTVANERSLLPALEKFGFDMIRLADLSVPRQASLMATAEHVVGPHGMGLTHLAFNEGQPSLIELHHPLTGTDAYAFMAKGLGFAYEPVIGSDAGQDNFRIEPDELESVLARHMRPRTSVLWRAPPRSWRLSPPFPGWFPGVQKTLAQPDDDVAGPSPDRIVFRHHCDGRGVSRDTNVGYWQLDKLVSGAVYDFSCQVLLPHDFQGEAVLLSLAELGGQQSADLTRRDVWQTLTVTRTCPEWLRPINLVLRIDAERPCVAYSSCWSVSPTSLASPETDA